MAQGSDVHQEQIPVVRNELDDMATVNLGPTSQRATYSRLLHEMQFRATRNALMNYYEAGELEKKRARYKMITNTLTAATASGVFAGILQKGKILANKAGLAGVVGFPLCGLAQFFDLATSDILPNYSQSAKKHVNAAAGWVGLAESARAERMRIELDPDRKVAEIASVYNVLVDKKAKVASEVLIPQETHRYFSAHPKIVLEAVKQRGDAYSQFVQLEMAHLPASEAKQKPAKIIYF